MKITKSQLKQIIKEELETTLSENPKTDEREQLQESTAGALAAMLRKQDEKLEKMHTILRQIAHKLLITENKVNEELEGMLTELDEEQAYYEMLSEGEVLEEAEYQGRKVTLNKPMKGDVKKSKVYVKDPKTGNVKKVNFGDPNMKIKKSNPKRRKSFRARHNCDNPGPKTKARYWSCKAW